MYIIENVHTSELAEKLYIPEDIFLSKYRKSTIWSLIVILVLVVVFFADHYLLPYQNTEDTIASYKEIRDEKDKLLGYRYLTTGGYVFHSCGELLNNHHLTVEHTLVFKNIKKVITERDEHSKNLISDYKRVNFYFVILLGACSFISLLCLLYSETLTDNGFLNIVLSNSFLTIFILIFSWLPW